MIYDVSVIMNTYQEKDVYLKQAIDSYLNQKKVNIQLIISTVENDTSIQFINKNYPNKIDLCIVSQKKHPGKGYLGIYYQLNKATKLIKHPWYAYASSNDVALLDKLYNEIKACIDNEKSICYSSYYTTNSNLGNKKEIKFYNYDYKKHLRGNFVNDCALIKTSLLKEFLPFRVEYQNHAYWDLWLRIYEKKGNVFIYNKLPAFNYRVCFNSLHIERKKDEKKKESNIHYRKLMLSHHNK